MSTIRILLVAVIAALSSNVVYAYDFEVDGIYYNILSEENKTCGVTANPATSYEVSGYKGAINIPKHVAYDNEVYTVTYIYKDAFRRCNKATSISLPNTIDSIATYAFYEAGILEITIPKSVKRLGSLCFSGCNKLQKVYYNAINCEKATQLASYFDDALKTVTIGSDVITLPPYLFYGCDSLRNVSFSEPSSLRKIETWAFWGCDSLKQIELPASLDSIGDYAFFECNVENVTIPESVRSMGSACFASNKIADLRVNFNAVNCSTSSIAGPFHYLQSNLVEIKFGDKVKSIPQALCYGAEKLTEIKLPASLESIGDYAFRGCIGLTTVELPQSLTNIGSGAFYNCVGLAAVKFPKSLISIGGAAFSGCTGLKSELTIPQNVESVGMSAFRGCTGLKTVTIESSETLLEAYAFSECTSIKSVNVFSTLPPIGTDDTFALITYRDATLNVPKTAKDAYTRQTCWRNFRHVEEKDFGGVDDVTADEGDICVNVRDRQIEVSGADASEEVRVYDMAGMEIYRGTDRTIALPTKGVYIVKVAGRTFKVAR